MVPYSMLRSQLLWSAQSVLSAGGLGGCPSIFTMYTSGCRVHSSLFFFSRPYHGTSHNTVSSSCLLLAHWSILQWEMSGLGPNSQCHKWCHRTCLCMFPYGYICTIHQLLWGWRPGARLPDHPAQCCICLNTGKPSTLTPAEPGSPFTRP